MSLPRSMRHIPKNQSSAVFDSRSSKIPIFCSCLLRQYLLYVCRIVLGQWLEWNCGWNLVGTLVFKLRWDSNWKVQHSNSSWANIKRNNLDFYSPQFNHNFSDIIKLQVPIFMASINTSKKIDKSKFHSHCSLCFVLVCLVYLCLVERGKAVYPQIDGIVEGIISRRKKQKMLGYRHRYRLHYYRLVRLFFPRFLFVLFSHVFITSHIRFMA